MSSISTRAGRIERISVTAVLAIAFIMPSSNSAGAADQAAPGATGSASSFSKLEPAAPRSSSAADTLSQNKSSAVAETSAGTPAFPAAPEPPPLPPRTTPPVLPAIPTLQPRAFVKAKPSLAWRHKALKVSLEKFKDTKPQETEAKPLLRFYAAAYSDTIVALAGACSALGLQVEQINSNAGELLASSSNGKERLVFSVWERPEGTTWVSAGIEKGNSTSASKDLKLILDGTGTTVSKRGRI